MAFLWMHMSVAYHSCYDNIALITTMMKTWRERGDGRGGEKLQAQQPPHIYMYVEKIYREWWIFENVDDDNVEWSEISGKEKLKKFAFHLSRSLFFFTWKNWFSQVRASNHKIYFPECSLSMLIIQRTREIQTPLAICIPPSQYMWMRAAKNYYSTRERSLLMEGRRKRHKK